jgi:cytoskeletal protein CcmA (bactofilin family)
MKPGEGTTVIGRAATFRGDLSSTEDLQIEGELEGTIRLSSGRLTVGAEARVRASITAPEVVVYGRVEGDIRATGRVDLRSTAVVLGDIFAARFSIEENAALRGYVDPARSGEAGPAPTTLPLAVAPPAVAARPAPVTGVLGVPRNPDLFNTQTGTALRQSRQMPSALAAIAAAGLPDPTAEAVAESGDEDPEAEGKSADDDAETLA